MPRKESRAFVEPGAADREAFTGCVAALLAGGAGPAKACLSKLNYALETVGGYQIAVERKEKFKGLGTYVVNPKFTRNLVLEVPHPLYDTGTLEESVEILEKTGARALFVAGTHRCANPETPSGCSGRTAACGGDAPFCISDSGHFERNFFTAAHRAVVASTPQPVAISVHGNASEPVDAELSDGTTGTAPPEALVNRLRVELDKFSVSAGSCNRPADNPARFKLCGGTNVQGRISNGSPDACTAAPEKASGTFIHVEQRLELRRNPAGLIRAIEGVFPAGQ